MHRKAHLKTAAALTGVLALSMASTNAASADRSDTPAGKKDCTSLPDAAQAETTGPITLTEVTEEVGLLDPLKGIYGHAAATGDVNGDGWLDLFVGTMKNISPERYERFLRRGATEAAPDRLLLGGPDGFTVDESFQEFPGPYYATSGAVFSDLDNDGDLDLVLSRGALGPESEDNNSVVLRNDDGEFSVAGTLTRNTGARTVAVLDYDDDGLMDLFLVEDHYANDEGSKLFRNTGDLVFEDVTEEAGLPWMQGLGATSADLNGDTLPDLMLSGTQRTGEDGDGLQTSQVARMFINQDDGTFREVDASAFSFPTATATDEVAGLAVGDLNRDGLLDVVQGNHIHDGDLLEEGVPAAKVYLHRGMDETGAPQFEDVTEAAGIPDVHTRVPHVEIVDFDADGWPDILTSLTRLDSTEPTVFQNLGSDDSGVPGFSVPAGLGDERTEIPGHLENPWADLVGIPRYFATGATADYDRDGRIDSFLVEWFAELPSGMFRNETQTGNALFVDVAPHNDAVGAKVEIFCAGGLGDPEALIGAQEVTVEVGYAGGIPTELHFGLGHAKKVDVRVTLPNDGGVIERERVRASQHLTVSAENDG